MARAEATETGSLDGPYREIAGGARHGDDSAAVPHIDLPDAPDALQPSLQAGMPVAWREPLTIRTYETGAPSRYPMYLDQRVYQGSSGAVYPMPLGESVADTPTSRAWDAVHLENEYLRVVVLPELGGRIHIGYDKSTGYDFFYRNNVIKPALVGLAGPWISGGVEFNWPQHHRPGTYLPVDTSIEHGADGSVTVWCHDHDPFARMSAQHGIRLRPGSSVVELVVRLHNRTECRQTFLWWANVAARVGDDYQAFFPQDVRYVADHARRALTAFPAADRAYYGVDYPALAAFRPGADRIDWYKNIPVPTSYMIVDSQQDFFGGYDHAAGAGFVHWAERRVSPGKKLWTWGDAPFGHAWDRQLTDGDGPYVELMAGVYTDNQPDFTWILPGETKTFTQYWYPIPAIGVAHQATPDAAVHVDVASDGAVTARFAVTRPQPAATMRVIRAREAVVESVLDILPGAPAELATRIGGAPVTAVELVDRDGSLLVRWQPSDAAAGLPWVAEAPPLPAEIDSVDELYLTGVHLSQNRHPTRSPLMYWQAAVERDPGHVAANIALADIAYRAGRYHDALAGVELALARLTRRNANPQDAEAYYLRGLILRRLGRFDEALQSLGKAAWDAKWAAAAGFLSARLLARLGHVRSAMRVLDELDATTGADARRGALRVMLLRRTGRMDEAVDVLRAARATDPLDATLAVLDGRRDVADSGILVDVALELRDAGEPVHAARLLEQALDAPAAPVGNPAPVAGYLLAQMADAGNAPAAAAAHRRRARAADQTWAFPNGLDALDALDAALAAEPDDITALSLRGMLLYAHGRREDAARDWRAATDLGGSDPVLLRNAGLAAYNVAGDDGQAWRLYERAVAAAPGDARLRYEQDELARRLGHSPQQRLERMRQAGRVVLERDDLALSYIDVLVDTGHADEAMQILTHREFHPWEGGEGRTLAAWDRTREVLGMPPADPPASLGETRAAYVPPAARTDDGSTDYFATSLPELMLFSRRDEGGAPQ